jgi:hypothetical protein
VSVAVINASNLHSPRRVKNTSLSSPPQGGWAGCYKMLEAAANERPNEWNANCFRVSQPERTAAATSSRYPVGQI